MKPTMTLFDSETDAHLKEQWATLPQALKDAISAAQYKEVVQSIARDNRMHIDQAGAVEQEILLVLLGLQSASEFQASLETVCGIPQGAAAKVNAIVQEKVFATIATRLDTDIPRDSLPQQASASPDTTDMPAEAPLKNPYKGTDPYHEPVK